MQVSTGDVFTQEEIEKHLKEQGKTFQDAVDGKTDFEMLPDTTRLKTIAQLRGVDEELRRAALRKMNKKDRKRLQRHFRNQHR